MLSSKRIKLTPPALDLVAEFRDALIESYDDHKNFLSWAEPNPTIEATRSNMADAVSNFSNRNEEFRYIVQRRSDDRIVGCVGLLIRDETIPFYEIGYWARSSEARKGYITEAVTLLERYAFHELDAKRLEIKMAESNQASRRVAEKTGFRYEATIHLNRKLPSGMIDNTLVYYKTNP